MGEEISPWPRRETGYRDENWSLQTDLTLSLQTFNSMKTTLDVLIHNAHVVTLCKDLFVQVCKINAA